MQAPYTLVRWKPSQELPEALFATWGYLSKATIAASLQRPCYRLFLLFAEENKEPIGASYICLTFDEADLHYHYIAKPFRQHGLGAALWRAVEPELAAEGVSIVTLEVAHTNTSALKLYQSLSFHPIHVRKKYYGNGDDAIIMQKSLT